MREERRDDGKGCNVESDGQRLILRVRQDVMEDR